MDSVCLACFMFDFFWFLILFLIVCSCGSFILTATAHNLSVLLLIDFWVGLPLENRKKAAQGLRSGSLIPPKNQLWHLEHGSLPFMTAGRQQSIWRCEPPSKKNRERAKDVCQLSLFLSLRKAIAFGNSHPIDFSPQVFGRTCDITNPNFKGSEES